ncbi:hypothetical protein GCM10011610_35280 [Nocardia rhizosphaerihabitans]|uniref:Uncharacterized protein n=1 Tax=Nocardia rhizosphaerihabitans TaxID=1691570 RepID=A0ABQ2KGZ2_9NOCA|nr:hypothetical protein GCM10011610_35280 [Nocardia rhizosphaerihabitans]
MLCNGSGFDIGCRLGGAQAQPRQPPGTRKRCVPARYVATSSRWRSERRSSSGNPAGAVRHGYVGEPSTSFIGES